MEQYEDIAPCARCERPTDILELYGDHSLCEDCLQTLAYEAAPPFVWLQIDPMAEYPDQETTHSDDPIGEREAGVEDVRYMRLSDEEFAVLRDLVTAACEGIVQGEKAGYVYTDPQPATLKGIRERLVKQWQ